MDLMIYKTVSNCCELVAGNVKQMLKEQKKGMDYFLYYLFRNYLNFFSNSSKSRNIEKEKTETEILSGMYT